MDILECRLKAVGLKRLVGALLKSQEVVAQGPLQLRHLRQRDSAVLGEIGERSEEEAKGIPQTPVDIFHMLEKARAHPDVSLKIRRKAPKPQDIRPFAGGDFLWGDNVSLRLGHFTPRLIDHKPMGKHRLVGGFSIQKAGGQEGGLEPSPMLVRSLKVKICRDGEAPLFQDKLVGYTGIKPNVQDIRGLLKIIRGVEGAEKVLRRMAPPHVRALIFHQIKNPGVNPSVPQDLPRLPVKEEGEGNAPHPLAGQAPIGAIRHHLGDTIAGSLRHPGDFRDSAQGRLFQACLAVHGNEPLGSGPINQGGF